MFAGGKGLEFMRPVGVFGRWTLMLAFGAAFGNAVQGRISLLIARLQFLLGDWIYIIK